MMKAVWIPQLIAPPPAYDRERSVTKELETFAINRRRVPIAERERKKLLGGKMMNENFDMNCTCDRDAFSQMPVPTPSVKDLQAEGLAITDAAIEVTNVIRKALFGDGPENNEKRNGPVCARAALMHQNMMLKELLENLRVIANELGC